MEMLLGWLIFAILLIGYNEYVKWKYDKIEREREEVEQAVNDWQKMTHELKQQSLRKLSDNEWLKKRDYDYE